MTAPRVDVAAGRALLEKATPGEFEVLGDGAQAFNTGRGMVADFRRQWSDDDDLVGMEEDWELAEADARAWVWLRNNAAALLDEIEALRAENERLREALKWAHNHGGCNCGEAGEHSEDCPAAAVLEEASRAGD